MNELTGHNIREKKGIKKKTKKKNYPMVKSSLRTADVSLRSSSLRFVFARRNVWDSATEIPY